ncbi:MAG TPA: class I SAM-dependent methyltransferase [Sphingomicrobium sp.]|nr:class I SAM-dependent methyltransferase [Sphingomicrobium sp.]
MQPLSDIPISVDAAAIEAAMRPFLVSEGEARRWRAEVTRRGVSTLARLLSGRESERDRESIEREYKDAWGAGYQRYRLDRTDLKPKPWHWRGRKLLLDPAAATRIRTILFGAVIDDLRPKRVLEVGSGNGINLLSLAGAFPEIEFTGLELTPEGVRQARRAQSDAAIAEIVRAYSPLETKDAAAIGRIAFVQGDASAMPFDDSSFDLVMTVLAVEQMESIRAAALREIARVTRGHALMLEPFRDMNTRGLKRVYVKSRGYFRGSIDELRGFGLEPVWATDDFPQEAFLGAALVLSKKRAADSR